MDLNTLTRTLIDIPSVTGSEAEVGQFLASHLEGRGYTVELQTLEGDRANLIATTGRAPRIVFSTHLDTVPPFIASSEDDANIYGRGACDAKGIIAAQITAAQQLRAGGLDEIGLLFTIEEETGGGGARLANSHPIAAECRYLINGEPTDNKLGIGSKGSLRLRLSTTGRAAHSAYPEQGESAIDKLLDILASIRAIEWPRDDFFGETTCNIGTISGGRASNVIASDAEALIHLRLVTRSELIKLLVENAVGGRAAIEYLSLSEPVRMLAVDGFEPCVVRFGTDIPYLTNWGKPLLLGPGSILLAHTAEERIAKAELREAVELYVRLARVLAARISEEPAKGATR